VREMVSFALFLLIAVGTAAEHAALQNCRKPGCTGGRRALSTAA
jgi:hypothetical protein